MNKLQNTVSEDKAKQVVALELLIILAFSIAVYISARNYDILERIVEFSWKHEHWEIDEFISVSFFIAIALAFFSVRRWNQLKLTYNLLVQRSRDLQKALSEIKQLRGIIPICAACKRIRDDKGYWHQVESYIRDHSEASFSHSICPECAKKLYPELAEQL